MSRSEHKKLLAYRAKQEEEKAQTIERARRKLVVGQEKLPLLDLVNAFYLSGFNSRFALVGILDAAPKDSNPHGYYCVSAGDVDIGLAYLVTGKSVSNLLCSSMPEKSPLNLLFQNYQESHPVALYFQGRDDGSWAKGFESETQALRYIETHPNFNQILDEHTIHYKDLEFLLKVYPCDEVMTMMDSFLFPIN